MAGQWILTVRPVSSLFIIFFRLLKSVLKRYATDIGEENLLKSTLCLLEVSAIGLLEVELLEILAKIDGTPGNTRMNLFQSYFFSYFTYLFITSSNIIYF